MKRWLLIPVTTFLVYSLACGKLLSNEASFLPHVLQSLKLDKSFVSARDLPIQDGAKDRHNQVSIRQVTPLYGLPRSQAAKALLDEANRQLRRIERSSYSHKTQVNELIGQFYYDCSGFLKYALERSVPDAIRSLQKATVRRPLAKHFVQFITALPPGKVVGHWRRVERVTDLAPGDIIAWNKPLAVDSDNTGHVMIVRDVIQRPLDRPNEIIIPIIDSTASSHGRNDSRYRSKSTGLGTGTIVLVVDKDNKAIGYRWSNSKKSRSHMTKVALGRLE